MGRWTPMESECSFWPARSGQLLIEDGRVSEKAMKREMLTRQQLLAALWREHVESPVEVSKAYIESDGRITVIPKRKRPVLPDESLRLRGPACSLQERTAGQSRPEIIVSRR